MLKRETNASYIVYPSWASLSYEWTALPRLLSDPLRSGYIPYQRSQLASLGYPDPPQRFDLLGGPAGGGIVRAEADLLNAKWLPVLILIKEANLVDAPGMRTVSSEWHPRVWYLEPYDSKAAALNFQRRTRLYLCSASVEHADAALDSVYWVVGFKKGKKEIDGLENLEECTKPFQLNLQRLDGIPESLEAETSPWFSNAAITRVWFKAVHPSDSVGFHFAILLYTALHLKSIAGNRLSWMHLVAQVEGKPNPRQRWTVK